MFDALHKLYTSLVILGILLTISCTMVAHLTALILCHKLSWTVDELCTTTTSSPRTLYLSISAPPSNPSDRKSPPSEFSQSRRPSAERTFKLTLRFNKLSNNNQREDSFIL